MFSRGCGTSAMRHRGRSPEQEKELGNFSHLANRFQLQLVLPSSGSARPKFMELDTATSAGCSMQSSQGEPHTGPKNNRGTHCEQINRCAATPQPTAASVIDLREPARGSRRVAVRVRGRACSRSLAPLATATRRRRAPYL
ncbi:unnamed protein product [Spodoptera exigua]|nr:unnamed protein product [Spodoptera exigua]